MDLKPVNSINNDSNTIRVSDGNSPIRLIFKDSKGEVINLYDKIDYFYLTKDDEKYYSVTDISYDGDEVIFRLPKLRKGQYKAEIRDKDGTIYPANEDLYILLRRSFEDDKDIYYFGHREDILNNVEPMVIQHIDKNPDKFRGERGLPGREGIQGKDGKDGKDGLNGLPGKDGVDGLPGKDGVDGLPGKDGVLTPEQYALINNKISKGEVTLDDLESEVLQKFQEVSPEFNLLSIPREGSVNHSKTTFINTSTNIFNPKDIVVGKSILSTTGALVDGSSFYTTNFIGVTPSTNYTSNRFGRVAFYDEDMNFISMSDTPNSFKTPGNCVYIRLHGYNSQLSLNPQINKGTTLLPYEDFKLTLSESVNVIVGNEDIVDNSISKEKVDFIKRSTNLYNPKTAIDGYYLNSTDGTLVADYQYITSDYILTEAEQLTLLGFRRTVFFDKDKNRISVDNYESDATTPNVINVPENAKSFRAHISKSNTVENPQINEGATLLPFEESFITIDGNRLPEYVEPSKSEQYYFPPVDVNPHYVSSDGIYTEMTLDELYDEYERLATDYPNYLKKTSFGKDESGEYDVLQVTLTPEGITPYKIEKTRPKIIIIANVHAYEKPSAYSVFYMIRALCEEWQNDPALEYLRFNVDFVIMPVMNPWGFVNGGYVNSNGVNLQVNFPTRWETRGSVGESMYAGPEPLSEVETNYCKEVIDENTDAMLLLDLHAQIGTNEIIYTLLPTGVDYNRDVELTNKYVMEKMTRHLHKYYNNPMDRHVGRIDTREGKGTIDAYSAGLGIPSNIVEHFLKFQWESESYSVESIKANTDYLIIFLLAALKQFKRSL